MTGETKNEFCGLLVAQIRFVVVSTPRTTVPVRVGVSATNQGEYSEDSATVGDFLEMSVSSSQACSTSAEDLRLEATKHIRASKLAN